MATRRRWTRVELRSIYDATSGNCSLCYTKLAFTNYGRRGARAAWHVDHSHPIARGGTNHGNNLRAACIDCNINKGTASSRNVRKLYGHRRAPYSKRRAAQIRERNESLGMLGGAIAGGAVGGPVGIAVGLALGAIAGKNVKVQ